MDRRKFITAAVATAVLPTVLPAVAPAAPLTIYRLIDFPGLLPIRGIMEEGKFRRVYPLKHHDHAYAYAYVNPDYDNATHESHTYERPEDAPPDAPPFVQVVYPRPTSESLTLPPRHVYVPA